MTESPELAGARRRWSADLQEVSEAVNSADPNRCPDAVVRALDSLYVLWEARQAAVGLKPHRDQEAEVDGDVDGMVTVALVFARGEHTHGLIVLGDDFTDTFAAAIFSHFGAWRWRAYAQPAGKYASRNAWYSSLVASEEVLPPLLAADRWLRGQPLLHF